MTMPALPPAGSTDWYAHYEAMDARARRATGFIYYAWNGTAYVTDQYDDGVSPRWYDGPAAQDPTTQAGHVARTGDKHYRTS